MPTGGPNDEDDNNGRESDLSSQEAWGLALNFSPGDEIILNDKFAMKIHDVNRNDSSIECTGKLQSGEGPWRVLRIDLTHYHSVKISTPEKQQQIVVDDIAPAPETILSVASADELLPRDLTGEETLDAYIAEREAGLEFSSAVPVVGECYCGGDIGKLERKAICESCGRWVPIAIWEEWRSTNPDQMTGSAEATPDGASPGGDGSGNRSLGDFM